jgi:hypothetical protein
MWVVPDDLEDAVRAATIAQLGDAPLATRALTAAIVDRSRRYTSERDRLSADRGGDLAARAAFFTIADAMKIAIPLGELAHRGALPAARPLRIVDLGAGCGAMSLGALVVLDTLGVDAALEIVAIDRDPGARRPPRPCGDDRDPRRRRGAGQAPGGRSRRARQRAQRAGAGQPARSDAARARRDRRRRRGDRRRARPARHLARLARAARRGDRERPRPRVRAVHADDRAVPGAR